MSRRRYRTAHPVVTRQATPEELRARSPSRVQPPGEWADPEQEPWTGVTEEEARAALTYWLNQQKRRHG